MTNSSSWTAEQQPRPKRQRYRLGCIGFVPWPPASVIIAGLLAFSALLAWMSYPAAAAAPAFTCPSGSVCTFTQPNLAGTGLNIPDSAIPSGTVFNLLDSSGQHAQSVRNRGGNTLWMADYQAGTYLCRSNLNWANTLGQYGHAERTGSYPCGGSPPPNLAP